MHIRSLKPPVTDQVQVSRELVALSVLNRDPLGAEDSSDRSPLVPLMVRGSLGEAEGGTIVSQMEEGGIMRHGVHPGGEDPTTHHRKLQQTLRPVSAAGDEWLLSTVEQVHSPYSCLMK